MMPENETQERISNLESGISKNPDEQRATSDEIRNADAASPDPCVLDVGLSARLAGQRCLVLALREAMESDRWLITVHRKIKDAPPDDLMHRYVMANFPIDNVVDAMQAQCRAILADEARHLERQQIQAAANPRWK